MAECECPICFEQVNAATTGRTELTCGHAYHFSCLAAWFSTADTCPLCRKKACKLESMPRQARESDWLTSRVFVWNAGDEPLPATPEEGNNADIDLVVQQTGASREAAIQALTHCEGDIINAIMELVAQ